MEGVEIEWAFKEVSMLGSVLEGLIIMPQAEEQVNAADLNAVGSHNDRWIGSRRPRPRL